ncbi:diguanylate cyclase [bacterium]|nr:diguanylate cyclase [bacterium]MBU1989528.1 diguanylate cyclase [bacterium]
MKKSIFASFIFTLIMTALLIVYLDRSKEEAINDFAKHSLISINASYQAVVDTYVVAATKDYYALMNNSEALQLLMRFKYAGSKKEENLLRGELYRILYKWYEQMKSLHVRQFHFHTHEGKSLLRFHLPYENGDSLRDFRKSVHIANTEKKSVFGFEAGRVYPGYRYIFPILYEGEHLGSVEFSISFEGIEEKLSKLLPLYAYQIIMSKNISVDKVFEWQRSLFSVSGFGENYYIENTLLSKNPNAKMGTALLLKLIQSAKESPDFFTRLSAGENFSVPVIDVDKSYIIGFIALEDTDNKHAGYIVSFGEVKEILDISKHYNSYIFMSILSAIFVFILLVVIIRQVDKLARNQKKLLAINDSLKTAQKIARFGSWELDLLKNKLHLSDEVYKIFGLEPESSEASYEVFFSFIHPEDKEKVVKVYNDSLKDRGEYEVRYRIVKKNGEVCFLEQHGSHETDENDKIVKSIGTVYDITQQVDAYTNLEKFIDLQSSIVILTDANEFKFANKSFYNFFGFESLKRFRENYNCICELFIHHESFFSLQSVREDEKNWIESLLNLSVRQRIVSMLDSTATPHAFNVFINKYDKSHFIVEFSDISESMMQKLHLERQLSRDQLTNAHNRVYFETNSAGIMGEHKKKGLKTGVIFFDIDYFKLINDTYGHDAGDEVLVEIVKLVQSKIRDTDHFIRWGGEEFVIIMGCETRDAAVKMAEHLRISIQENVFKGIQKLTCSFGVAIKEDEETIKAAITRADQKLYEAKNGGRNKVCV